MTLRAALVGAGTWGKNLARVIAASPRATLVAIADPNVARRAAASTIAPGARLVPSLDDALALGVDAVLIAAPPELHASLVARALGAGADVFVEKPMAIRVVDAERCAARAKALGRVGMVGHLLRFHPTVERLVEIARSGELGRLVHVESVRRSVGSDRGPGAIWALGPHDLSVLEAIDPSARVAVTARGAEGGDPVEIDLELASGLTARLALSRTSPTKERRIRVVGRAGTLVFDDLAAPDRLVLDGREIEVPWEEPLAREVDHFFACVSSRATPRTSFEDGVSVVRALAEAEASLVTPPTQSASHVLL